MEEYNGLSLTEQKLKSANWALYYIKSITADFIKKVRYKINDSGKYKIFVHDKEHNYDKNAIALTIKTFERRNMGLKLSKFKKTTHDSYAYIFELTCKNS